MSNRNILIKSSKDCDLVLLDKTLSSAELNVKGNNLLINATIFGRPEYDNKKKYIAKLLEMGIDVNQKLKTGKTALHYASSQCDLATVKQLLNSGINVNSVDENGKNALMYTCENIFLNFPRVINRKDIDELEYSLYEYNQLQNIYNKMYYDRKTKKQLLKNQLEIIKYLLENGIDKNQTSEGKTALDFAVENYHIKDTEMVEILDDYGVKMKQEHNEKFNYFDELFSGGISIFVNDYSDYKLKVKKLKKIS